MDGSCLDRSHLTDPGHSGGGSTDFIAHWGVFGDGIASDGIEEH
jgi:hypothetical protein